jgi:hypothetical protein
VVFLCVCQCKVNCVATKEPLTTVVCVPLHTARTAMQYVYRRYSPLHTSLRLLQNCGKKVTNIWEEHYTAAVAVTEMYTCFVNHLLRVRGG